MNNRKTWVSIGLIVTIIFLMVFFYYKIGPSSGNDVNYIDLATNHNTDRQLKPTILFGDELDYPPYSFVDEFGNPTGYSIELAKSVAEVMGYNAVITQESWDLVLQNLDNGKIDAISGIFYSDERSKKYDFTTKYTVARGDVFTKKGTIIRDISELEGKTIVVPSGDIVHEYLKSLNYEMKFIPVETASEALALVAAGTYDYAAVLKIPGIYLIKDHKLTNLRSNGLQIAPQDYCMAVKKGNNVMLATLNEGLQILNQTGEYKEINEKWLGAYEDRNAFSFIIEHLWMIAVVVSILVILVVWIFTLRLRVAAKTKDLLEANQKLKSRHLELQFSNNSLAVLNKIALEQLGIKSKAELIVIINKQIKMLTGCSLSAFSEYDDERKVLVTTHINADNKFINHIKKLSGDKILNNETPVSDIMYESMVSNKIIKDENLFTFLQRPSIKLLASAVQKSLNIDRFILISYTIDGKLFGTSMIALEKNQESPLEESLNFFAFISAISIKRSSVEDELREAIQFNQEIIQNAQEGIIVYGKDYSYKLWNNYMEKLTFITEIKAIGKLPNDLFPFLANTNLYENIDRGLKGEIFLGEDYQAEIGEAKSLIWISQSYGPLKNAEGIIVGVISTVQDITDRKKYEEHLKYISLHDHLTNLYNRALFEVEMKIFQKSREYPITIISCDLDGLKIINDTMGHNQGDKLLISCSELIQNSLREGDVLARIGGDEFAAILPNTDFETSQNIVKRIREKVDLYNSGSLELPLSISIGISTTHDNSTSLEKVLKNADEKMYHEKLIQKKSSRSQIIESLMVALAEKDYITEGHSQRLSIYAEKMARSLGLPNDIITNINLLAQVHDLGKVGIPDHILLKNGKLTEEEWIAMKQHPEKGYRIAIASPDLSQIADLILKHHEHWDGNGYQLGIKGEEIPIECRILAIVDAYDAMTNDRPYSKARGSQEAIKEIVRCSGTQFDPNLVDLFLKIVE